MIIDEVSLNLDVGYYSIFIYVFIVLLVSLLVMSVLGIVFNAISIKNKEKECNSLYTLLSIGLTLGICLVTSAYYGGLYQTEEVIISYSPLMELFIYFVEQAIIALVVLKSIFTPNNKFKKIFATALKVFSLFLCIEAFDLILDPCIVTGIEEVYVYGINHCFSSLDAPIILPLMIMITLVFVPVASVIKVNGLLKRMNVATLVQSIVSGVLVLVLIFVMSDYINQLNSNISIPLEINSSLIAAFIVLQISLCCDIASFTLSRKN